MHALGGTLVRKQTYVFSAAASFVLSRLSRAQRCTCFVDVCFRPSWTDVLPASRRLSMLRLFARAITDPDAPLGASRLPLVGPLHVTQGRASVALRWSWKTVRAPRDFLTPPTFSRPNPLPMSSRVCVGALPTLRLPGQGEGEDAHREGQPQLAVLQGCLPEVVRPRQERSDSEGRQAVHASALFHLEEQLSRSVLPSGGLCSTIQSQSDHRFALVLVRVIFGQAAVGVFLVFCRSGFLPSSMPQLL